MKWLSMFLFVGVGKIVAPNHILIQLLIAIVGYNIPLFIDYLRMNPKRLLKFHQSRCQSYYFIIFLNFHDVPSFFLTSFSPRNPSELNQRHLSTFPFSINYFVVC